MCIASVLQTVIESSIIHILSMGMIRYRTVPFTLNIHVAHGLVNTDILQFKTEDEEEKTERRGSHERWKDMKKSFNNNKMMVKSPELQRQRQTEAKEQKQEKIYSWLLTALSPVTKQAALMSLVLCSRSTVTQHPALLKQGQEETNRGNERLK